MSSIFPEYNTQLFTDIYGDVDSFVQDYLDINLGGLTIVDESGEDYGLVPKLFYLLYGKFGNSPIANMDVNQFKYKLFSVIWQYGPTWESRLDIQGKLRDLLKSNNEADLLKGTKAIYNHALNPETLPKTGDLDELDYINEQNTTNYKKSKMDAYAQLWDLLATDVTEWFLSRFDGLFNKFVKPVKHMIYATEEDDE